jgi:glycosyltransferase involved in cell wall biosynthesis
MVERIAYLTPLYFDARSTLGGGERYAVNIARAVVRASGGSTSADIISYGEFPRAERIDHRVMLRILKRANHPPTPLDSVSWDIPDAIRGADIVHIHQAFTRSSEVGLLAAKLQKKPVCVTDHGGVTSRVGFLAGSMSLFDRIICYSQYAASLFHSDRTTTIPGGVDDEYFTPPVMPGDRDGFLYVGRLLPHKGIDRLLAALPDDLSLTIFGRPYHQPYYRLLRQLARGKNVEFVVDGDDSLLRSLYQRTRAVILPSVYRDSYGGAHIAPELMGLTMLEGMACGAAALCPPTAALPEFIRHGETGYIYKSLAELRQRLRRLAVDDELVASLGTEARRVVTAEYNLMAVGKQLLGLYEGLVADARSTP